MAVNNTLRCEAGVTYAVCWKYEIITLRKWWKSNSLPSYLSACNVPCMLLLQGGLIFLHMCPSAVAGAFICISNRAHITICLVLKYMSKIGQMNSAWRYLFFSRYYKGSPQRCDQTEALKSRRNKSSSGYLTMYLSILTDLCLSLLQKLMEEDRDTANSVPIHVHPLRVMFCSVHIRLACSFTSAMNWHGDTTIRKGR